MLAATLATLFVVLAMLRPVDHDESQYVAAAMLTADGLLPYRDFAYLQTPLQPFAFAPIAWAAGGMVWPALRIVNALCGAVAVIATVAAALRAGGSWRASVAAGMLFACCDILLFSIGTARNDALPAALLAVALLIASRLGRHRRGEAMLIGALLGAATAAKVSYAFPALAYGAYALWHRDRTRAVWVMAGVVPVALFVGWTAMIAPHAFWFDVIRFPAIAPDQYYRADGRAWKLSATTKIVDIVKFLALGPALFALVRVGIGLRPRQAMLVMILIIAGIAAALLPTPTWRHYLLPVLPPLFVGLALVWTARAPGAPERIAVIIFAVAGLAPTIAAVASGGGMASAGREAASVHRTLAKVGARGPIATLSPQFVAGAGAAIDPRFATGPFYFRSSGLLSAADERAMTLLSRDRLPVAALPPVILTGGEGKWTSGDDGLDRSLADRARFSGYRPIAIANTHFTLWTAR